MKKLGLIKKMFNLPYQKIPGQAPSAAAASRASSDACPVPQTFPPLPLLPTLGLAGMLTNSWGHSYNGGCTQPG